MNEVWNVLVTGLVVIIVLCAGFFAWVFLSVNAKRRQALRHIPEINEIWSIDSIPIVIRKVTQHEIQWSYIESGNTVKVQVDTINDWFERIKKHYVQFSGRKIT